MNRRSVAALTMMFAVSSAATAQDHPHAAEKLGHVHFETSCAPAVSAQFDRAIALLHSFEFRAAIQGFQGVLAADSSCAMAHWGIAVSQWTNPMTINVRPPALLDRGRAAADAGARIAARRATPREREYIAAVSTLYADPATRDQRTRVLAYEQAMGALAAKYPADLEARVFHAISLVASALPSDKTYANQLRAGAMLEEMFAKNPEHPGLAHYIIHSYDVPALVDKAAAAARRYADIAPSAAHALHMPSHTFTRVGLWNESVATNLRSQQAAERDSAAAEALHAMDYATYAYLQMRRDSAAGDIVARIPALAARFNPEAVTGAAPGSAGLFAIAAIPARYALERDAWQEAATLQPRPTAFPYTEGLTYFARALGGARSNQPAVAQSAIDSLAAIHGRLTAAREAYWAEQVAIQRIAAEAWLDFTSGMNAPAIAKMREAALREDATEKAAVTPGPLMPARELLGDMLMEANRPTDALVAYRAALAREPNRYRSVRGAARAARAAGETAAAAGYERQLNALSAGARP